MSLLLLLLACGNKNTPDEPQVQDLDADGVTVEEGDCNDEDASVYPGNTESCDGIDNDCNGEIDEGLAQDFYVDGDGDGFGSALDSEFACEAPEGYVSEDGDCDDADATVNPGAEEVCDDIDNNCDGAVDDADPLIVGATAYYLDYDGDGYGNAGFSEEFCTMPAEYADNDQDCDDLLATVNPDAEEVCDGIDNNCDGAVDDADANIQYTDADNWYADLDMDGYGETSNVTQSCLTPTGSSNQGGDCDDNNSDVNPAAEEVCDGIDNNCDALVDDADPTVSYTADDMWYVDADQDSFGNPNIGVSACDQPSGFVADSTDCDDLNALNNPTGTEVCDGVDNDCDALVDDDDSSIVYGINDVWYVDADGDGYGTSDQTSEACAQPSGYVSNTDDCDDADATTNPTTVWYADVDMDGFGNPNNSLVECVQPVGYILDNQDCDDADERTNPLMAEICGDGVSNDCDPVIDGAATCDLSQDLADWATFSATGDDNSFFARQIRSSGNAVSGVQSVLVSANRADTNGLEDNGAIYLYDTTQLLTGTSGPSGATASIHGSTAGDLFGTIVVGMDPLVGTSSADVNNDGISDLAVSAIWADPNGNKSGSVYVFQGGFSGDLDADTQADAILLGMGTANQAGYDLSFIDANNDGSTDLLVGAPYFSFGTTSSGETTKEGAVYLIHGPMTSGDLETQADAIFYGENVGDHAGLALVNAGDMDGDGLDDFAISSYRADPINPQTMSPVDAAGITYVFTGTVSGVTSLDDADMKVYGDIAFAYSGHDLFKAGDINGDGLSDLLVGARARPTNGSSFLVSGDTALPSEMWLQDATARMDGNTYQAEFGKSAAALGDINGDGYGDVAIGSKKEDVTEVDSGSAHIYYGPLAGVYEGGDYHGIFKGVSGGDEAGITMANVGDLDGSGVNDLMVGAFKSGSNAGTAYLLLGADLQQ